MRQMRSFFPSLPVAWQSWEQIARERTQSDAWALAELAKLDDETVLNRYRVLARDYGEYARTCDLREAVLAYDQRYVGAFLRNKYGSMAALCQSWGVSLERFATIESGTWSGEPIDERTYVPLDTAYYRDLLDFRKEYREGKHAGLLRNPSCTADYLRPAALAYVWESYASRVLNITNYAQLHSLPFPVPVSAPPEQRQVWQQFVQERFPLRHIGFVTTPTRCTAFAKFLEEKFHTVANLNRVMHTEYTDWKDVADWTEVELAGEIPPPPFGRLWMEYVGAKVPFDEWIQRDTLPEVGFQTFALNKYGTLPGVNTAYALDLKRIEELRIPFREALLVTFHDQEKTLVWQRFSTGYQAIGNFLYLSGRAVTMLVILLILSFLVHLTVNSWAGYVLAGRNVSIFRKIAVFGLAVLAFPAAAVVLPDFLRVQELGVANTLGALSLPLVASVLSVLLLQRQFRRLPPEMLAEVAATKGVAGMRVFLRRGVPQATGVLLCGILGSVMAAHLGWEWSLVVSRDPAIWTMAAWTNQFTVSAANQTTTAWAVFAVNALPVVIVYLFGWHVWLRRTKLQS
jgi:fructooligosaccharide transport system permease protein